MRRPSGVAGHPLLGGEDDAAGVDQVIGGDQHARLPVDGALHAGAGGLAGRVGRVGVGPFDDHGPLAHAVHRHRGVGSCIHVQVVGDRGRRHKAKGRFAQQVVAGVGELGGRTGDARVDELVKKVGEGDNALLCSRSFNSSPIGRPAWSVQVAGLVADADDARRQRRWIALAQDAGDMAHPPRRSPG